MATVNEAEVQSQMGGAGPSRATLSALLSVVFLDNLGYAIVFPYLFFYVSSLGASAFIYGLLLSSYSLMSFVFTPLIARLSDRYGRRSILLPALLISGLSYIVFGLADVLWLLFLARMIAGTTAATVPVAQAYVADVTTEKQRLKYLGWTSAAGGLAFIVGQAIGGVLSGFFGYAVPSFLAAGLAFANLFSSYFLLREPACPPGELERGTFTLTTFRDTLKKGRMALLFVVYFMFFTSFVFLQAVVPPWLQTLFGFGSLQTSFLFAYIGVMSVLTQAFILPRLSKKTGNTTLALYGIILLSAGLLALGTLPYLALLVVMGALVAVGFGILITTLSTLISVNAPKEAQGGSLGIAQSLAALAQTVGPTVAASFFALGSSVGIIGLAFIISAVITLCTIPLIVNFKKHQDTGKVGN
jgi:DHA1 family tetracycline resistance protein-like MFS transporter